MKLADEMRLVEVAQLKRKIRPIRDGIGVDQTAGLLKPLNAAEEFRRQSNLGLEDLDKATLAQTDISRSFPDRRSDDVVNEHLEGRLHRVVLLDPMTQASEKRRLEQTKALDRRSRFAEALAKPNC